MLVNYDVKQSKKALQLKLISIIYEVISWKFLYFFKI